MLGFLLRLFAKPAPALSRVDPDLGAIYFQRSADGTGSWWMDGPWSVDWQAEPLKCLDIPGDESGPAPEARAFLLAKRRQHEAIWAMAEPAVRDLMQGWPDFDGHDPRQAFFISTLAKDDAGGNGWEVCFDSRPPLKWVNFCLQVEGDECVTNTIST